MAIAKTNVRLSKTGPFSFSGFQDEVMTDTNLRGQSWLSHPEVLQAANVASNNSMLALRDVIQGQRKTRPVASQVKSVRDLEFDKSNNPPAYMSVMKGNSGGGPVGGWLNRPDPGYMYCYTLGQKQGSPSSLNWNQYFKVYNTEKIKIRVNGSNSYLSNTGYALVINGYNSGFNAGPLKTFLNTSAESYLQQYQWFEMTPDLYYPFMVVSCQHFFGAGSGVTAESSTWGLEVRRA